MDERLQKYSFLENPKYGYEQTYNSWNCYWGLKLHFTTEHYDLFKYGGKTRMSSKEQMDKYFSKRERNGNWCPERTVLYRVGKNLHRQSGYDSGFFDCYSFFIHQFINGVTNLHDMDTDDWECSLRKKHGVMNQETIDQYQDHDPHYGNHDFDKESWDVWKNRVSIGGGGWKSDFTRNVEEIVSETDTFDELFEVRHINHPKIFKLYLYKTISIETMILLNSVLGFVPNLDKKLVDPVWKDFKFLFDKYRPIYSWMMTRSDEWFQHITHRREHPYLGTDVKKEVKKILLKNFSN